jgi:hypothetical protein
MPEAPTPAEQTPQRGHTRRPPLAEVDSWDLWQAWQRGERARVLPWIALLVGFSVVLAAMYSFFFISSLLSQDSIAPFALIFVLIGFLYWTWKRISTRRAFSFAIVSAIFFTSALAFGLWLAISWLLGGSVWAGIFGSMLLGLLGLGIALLGLNRIARDQGREIGD